MPSNYIKDRITGKLYKLSTGGYYQPYTGDTGGEQVPETSGVQDYYSNLAKQETDPYYNTQTQSAKTEADLASRLLASKVASEYANKGLLRSSMYGDVYTGGQAMVGRDLASRLAEIEKARTGAYETSLGNYTNRQMAGEAQDEQARIAREEAAARQAELERQYAEAEKERQYNERMRQIELATVRARASSSGSSSNINKWQADEIKRQDLNQTIAGAVESWARREQDRAKRGEAPGWESEEIYVPKIKAEAARLGLDPEAAAGMFYNLRDSYFRR